MPHLGEPGVGGAQHTAHPLAAGVESRAPRLGRDIGGVTLPQHCLHLITARRAPARAAAVGEEDDGAHDAVAQRPAVAVLVVGLREAHAVGIGHVAHERDRRGIAAERRAGERQPPRRAVEGLAHGVAPAQSIAAVVHLVENDEGRRLLDEHAVHERLRRDLRVGDGRPVESARNHARRVAEGRIETDAHAMRGVCPLALQVLGGGDNDDAFDGAAREQLGSEPQGERGLAGTGRGSGEKVARFGLEILVERFGLPGSQPVGGAARSPLGVGG